MIHKFCALVVISLSTILFTSCSPSSDADSPMSIVGNSHEEIFQRENIVKFGLRGTKKIALTFDDGPSVHTRKLLDMLRRENVAAAFFLRGDNVARTSLEPGLRQIKADRHIVGNHTYDHPSFARRRWPADPAPTIRELQRTHQLILPYLLPTQRLYFRAPYGDWQAPLADILNGVAELRPYIGPIFWTIGGAIHYDRKTGRLAGAADWDCWSRMWSVNACLEGYLNESETQKGGVVLMHDSGLHPETIDRAERYITAMKAKGYEFITLDEVGSLDQYQ